MKQILKKIQKIQFSIMENENLSMSVSSDNKGVLVFLHSKEEDQDKIIFHWTFGFLKTEDKKQLKNLKNLCQELMTAYSSFQTTSLKKASW